MIEVMVKSNIENIELSAKTTVDNEDEAKNKLKVLYELVESSKKEMFPPKDLHDPEPFIMGIWLQEMTSCASFFFISSKRKL